MKAMVCSGNDLWFDGTNYNLRVNIVIASDSNGRSREFQVIAQALTLPLLTKAVVAAAIVARAAQGGVTVDEVIFEDFTSLVP